MKRNMNLKATAGILLAQATMLGAIAAPTVTAKKRGEIDGERQGPRYCV